MGIGQADHFEFSNMKLTKNHLIAFLFPLLLSLPFLNRAFFVDDSYFVEISEWIKDNPTEPYHFKVDDTKIDARGWEEDGFVRMVNPLLHHYYLAGLMKFGLNKVWFLRLGAVFLVCLSGIVLFELARRWTRHPLLVTCLTFATPSYWLTTHSLLIDSTMGAFFLFGLYFFVRATEKNSVKNYLISGLFMGGAILAKYPGVFVLPLTGLWAYMNRKKIKDWTIVTYPWVIALCMLVLYSWYTYSLYGQPHILAASVRMVNVYGWAKILIFIVFFSGVSLVPLFSWREVSHEKKIVLSLVVFLLMLFFSSSYGGFTIVQGLLLALWTVTSFVFLGVFISLKKKWRYPKDYFLFYWVLGFVAMMLIVMGWVAGRYFVIVLPAITFMGVRIMEMKRRSVTHLKWGLALVISFTSLLAYADYKQAEPARTLGVQLEELGYSGGERHYYLGDSFTMSYLKDYGWVPCFPDTVFKKGDFILSKEVTMPQSWFFRRPINLKVLADLNYPTRFPLKVMDYHGSAGFYASVWGALPFTFSTGPWENFKLYQVVSVHDAS